ncbi:MAG: cysteine desulfurase NifS [Deltaproteobacteria bacterium]|nr:cysteine desulfurase NifS [Deltaproteobacteria bacterium]RLA89838.1 MAG: cysteine desulfurase NifS [Deltaproteobacteria bacterium]
MRKVYVDNNATTRVAPEVVEEMLPFFSQDYGNPSSIHFFGGKVAQKMAEAREKVAALLGAEPTEIIFTSCGTESDNAAIFSALENYPNKKQIVTTNVEHHAILNFCKYLKEKGYLVTELSVDQDGQIDLDELRDSITDDTAIVSIMYANNETGVIFPIDEIEKIVKEKGVLFHTDAVQAVGKVPIDLSKRNIDMLSLSGHKLHAPKGIGVLYIKKGTKFSPFIIGGEQEFGKRGGTENVPYIIGLGKACEIASKDLEKEITRIKAMRDRLEKELTEKIPDIVINGGRSNRLPNTLNIGFKYVEGEAILLHLSNVGIAVSTGSACSSGSEEPSHVLKAMGVPASAIHGSIRFSLSRYNNEEDIDYIIEKLPPIIEKLREISPFSKTTMINTK